MRFQTTVLALAVSGALGMSAAGQSLLLNGGFETDFTGWTHTGDVQIATDHPHSGSKLAAFGAGNGTQPGILQQTVKVPSTPTTLSMFVSENTVFNHTVAHETLTCELLDTRGDLLETLQVFAIRDTGLWYEQYSFPLDAYANRTIIIQFRGACGTSYPASFLLDDVNVTTITNAQTSLAGKVTDKSTGNPVSGAIVTLGTSTTATNASGQYLLSTIACQTSALNIAKSGYSVWQQQYTPVCGTANTLDVPLTPVQRTTTISGRVTNIVTGSVVSAVTIKMALVSTTSNTFGGYSLAGVDCQTGTLTARAVGYQPWQESVTPACGSSTVVNIVLTPVGATSIEGIVTNAYTPHEPVPGVTVSSYPHTTTTDSAGHYQFYVAGCPAGGYLGDFVLLLTKTNWTIYNPHVTLTCGIANEVNLEYPPWTVSGGVYDAVAHKPLDNVTMTWGTAVTTAHAGGYFFSGLCQNATLTASKTGYRSFSENFNTFCPLTNGWGVSQISLTPTGTNIFVNVIDPASNPLPVANVQWGAYAITGQEDQSYGLFNVPCQTAVLSASMPYYQTVQQSYTPPKCGTSNVATVTLARSSSDVEGQVTDLVRQTPLVGAKVSWGAFTTTTDKDGTFRFRMVPCGIDTLTVTMPLYTPLSVKAESNCQQWSVWLKLPLQPTTAIISGTVSSSSKGPLNGATVTWGTSTSTTDGKGHYQLTGVPCQPGTLTASMTGYSTMQQTFTPSCSVSTNTKSFILKP